MKFLRTASVAAMFAIAPASSFAQTFNIDIGSSGALAGAGPPSSTYAAAGVAGVWQEIDATSVNIVLNDISGAATLAKISAAPPGVLYSFNNATTSGDDDKLMDDIQDLGFQGAAATTWTITGLVDGTYRLILYSWAPDNRIYITDITVNGGAAGTQQCGNSVGFSGHVDGQTYVDDVVTTVGGVLSWTVQTNAAGGFGNFNGFQLEPLVAAPTSYCTAGTSTNNCAPQIAASANPSVSFANACTFTATGVEGQKSGIIFYGVNNTGFSPAPWAAGSASFLCVKGPTQRMNVLNSGGTLGSCNGSLVQDWNAFQAAHPTALGNPFVVGNSAFVQAWYRDPPAVKTTNLSNAVQVFFVP